MNLEMEAKGVRREINGCLMVVSPQERGHIPSLELFLCTSKYFRLPFKYSGNDKPFTVSA
jgi:hypothetical protein